MCAIILFAIMAICLAMIGLINLYSKREEIKERERNKKIDIFLNNLRKKNGGIIESDRGAIKTKVPPDQEHNK